MPARRFVPFLFFFFLSSFLWSAEIYSTYRYYNLPMRLEQGATSSNRRIPSPFYICVNTVNVNKVIDQIDSALPGVGTVLNIIKLIKEKNYEELKRLSVPVQQKFLDMDSRIKRYATSHSPIVEGKVKVINVFFVGEDLYYLMENDQRLRALMILKQTGDDKFLLHIPDESNVAELLTVMVKMADVLTLISASKDMDLKARIMVPNPDNGSRNPIYLCFNYTPVHYNYFKEDIQMQYSPSINEVLHFADRLFRDAAVYKTREKSIEKMGKKSGDKVRKMGREEIQYTFGLYSRKYSNLVVCNENVFFVFNRFEKVNLRETSSFDYKIFLKDSKGFQLVNYLFYQIIDTVLDTPEVKNQLLRLGY